MATEYFRQPNGTRKVKGRRDVGIDGEGTYRTQVALAPDFNPDLEIGLGSGETPEDARRDAIADLKRQLRAAGLLS